MSELYIHGYHFARVPEYTDKIFTHARLSLGALGMVMYLIKQVDMHQGDEAPQISQEHLFERFSENSSHQTRKALNELKDKEYLEYRTIRQGRRTRVEWHLHFNRIFSESLLSSEPDFP